MDSTSLNSPPRILLALPQFPHDPASGAARTATTIGEMLAAAAFPVRSLATTASEGDLAIDPYRLLADAGTVVRVKTESGKANLIRFTFRGVEHVLMDTNGCEPTNWQKTYGSQYDSLFEEELARFRPQILFTYGGLKSDIQRQCHARARGCRVVFGLFNLAYSSSGSFAHVDAIITPSEFLSTRYAETLGLHSTPLPTPLRLEDVLVTRRTASRLTMINPSIGKGCMFIARLAEELGMRFPEIPFEIVQSRGSGRLLVQAGFVAGFDLRRHGSLIVRVSERMPRDIYKRTRVLIVPSVAEEASARVVAEALVNDIPVIASDRGGLPENCGTDGLILALPSELTPHTRRPVDAVSVQPWIDAITALYRDGNAYEQACVRAHEAGKRYLPEVVAPQYVSFFQKTCHSEA